MKKPLIAAGDSPRITPKSNFLKKLERDQRERKLQERLQAEAKAAKFFAESRSKPLKVIK